MDITDIVIAVLLALATFRLTYLGVQLNPQHKSAVFAIAGAVLFLLAWQAYRSSQSQHDIQTQLSNIQKSTKDIADKLITPQLNSPPVQVIPDRKERSLVNLDTQFVTGRRPPFTSKNSFIINVKYTNVSAVPARVTGVWASVYAFDHRIAADEEDRLFGSLKESAKSHGTQDNFLGPSQYAWFTIEPKPLLNDETAARLADGKLYIYIMTVVVYSDSSGSHETDLCRYFYGVHASIHQCYSHNGPRI